jgi:hypothetical protein
MAIYTGVHRGCCLGDERHPLTYVGRRRFQHGPPKQIWYLFHVTIRHPPTYKRSFSLLIPCLRHGTRGKWLCSGHSQPKETSGRDWLISRLTILVPQSSATLRQASSLVSHQEANVVGIGQEQEDFTIPKPFVALFSLYSIL